MSAKVATITMRRALNDPALLGKVLDGESWQAWRVLLIAMMGEALTDEERPIFTKLTGREREPLQRVEEFWGIIGRRGGKSRAISALAVFLAVFRAPKNLAVGERPVVLCLAQNQKQAAVVLGYAAGIIEDTPLLATLIKNRTSDSIELTNGVAIEVRAASFRGIRGVTAAAVICDEIAFWYSSDGTSVNPAEEILNAVRPALASTGGPLFGISSPYARRGPMWEADKRHYGPNGDPLILVAHGASWDLNPSPQLKKFIDRAYESDPISAAAEYGAQHRSDLEAFVNLEAAEACVSLGVFERAPLSSQHYCGFVDPSGGSADSMTLGIAHLEGEVPILDAIREQKPPFSPEACVASFVETLKTYGVTKVHGDRYAGEWPRQQFRKHGIDYEPSERNRSEIYGELLPLINSGKCELLDDKKMITQLVSLERRTSRAGKDSIDHPPGQHDDRINAAAGAIVLASAGKQPMVISQEFLNNIRSLSRRPRYSF